MHLEGVAHATVATHTPGSMDELQKDFTYIDKEYSMAYIGVDFDYFETLGIDLLEGRTFQSKFPADSTNTAIINETVAKQLGLSFPIGKILKGCNTDFVITGVVKDSKMQGFENLTKPTVYTIQNACGKFKSEILLKLKPGQVQQTLAEIEKNWTTINKRDGYQFNYEFVDQKYAQLSREHELLQAAFTGFTILAIVIAVMGLLGMTIHAVSLREKELSIRKIMGASPPQLFILLKRPFITIVFIALCIATPIVWWIMNKWLEVFSYRIQMEWWMFVISGAVVVVIALCTVSTQAIKAAVANPVKSLRAE